MDFFKPASVTEMHGPASGEVPREEAGGNQTGAGGSTCVVACEFIRIWTLACPDDLYLQSVSTKHNGMRRRKSSARL